MSRSMRQWVKLGLTVGLSIGAGSIAQAGGHSGGGHHGGSSGGGSRMSQFRHVTSNSNQQVFKNSSSFQVQKLQHHNVNPSGQFAKKFTQATNGSAVAQAVHNHKFDPKFTQKLHQTNGSSLAHHQFKSQVFKSQFVNHNFSQKCVPFKHCGWNGCGQTPKWNHWMGWCWNPCYNQSYNCQPCTPWVYWNYPTWQPLCVYTCGSYTDLPAVVAAPGADVELAAVRFVDPGHPEQQLGPRYRVWVRNNRPTPIEQSFNVVLMAANSTEQASSLPQAGVKIASMQPEELKAVDVRLPFEATSMGVDEQGQPAPFSSLHVLVDSHRELDEEREDNNGTVVARTEIMSIDPAIFATRKDNGPEGSTLEIAGEGLGPQPGSLILTVGGVKMQAEVMNWSDLGAQVRFPNLPLAPGVQASLSIQRTDGAISNELAVDLTGSGSPTTAAVAAPVAATVATTPTAIQSAATTPVAVQTVATTPVAPQTVADAPTATTTVDSTPAPTSSTESHKTNGHLRKSRASGI